jgi:hypothetical protein
MTLSSFPLEGGLPDGGLPDGGLPEDSRALPDDMNTRADSSDAFSEADSALATSSPQSPPVVLTIINDNNDDDDDDDVEAQEPSPNAVVVVPLDHNDPTTVAWYPWHELVHALPFWQPPRNSTTTATTRDGIDDSPTTTKAATVLQVILPEDDDDEEAGSGITATTTAGYYDATNALPTVTVVSINPMATGTSSSRAALLIPWVLPCMIALAITVIAVLMTKNESSSAEDD